MDRRERGLLTYFALATIAAAAVMVAFASAASAKGTVYSTGNSNELQAKPIAADGSLETGTATPTGSAVTPRGIAITPDARFLYMTTTSNNLLGFNISGPTPAQVSGSPYNVTDTFGYGLAITPNGQFLYTLNQNGGTGTASIFSINNDGSLTKVGANVPLGYQGDGVAVAPSGQFLYITDTTNNTVHSYSIAGDGTIAQVGTPRAAGTSPKGIAVSPNGAFVFTSAVTGPINAFPVQGDGTLSTATSTVNTGLSPQTVAVTQDGQFLYAADFNTPGRVSGYAIGANGSLTPIPGQPFASTNNTYGIDAAPGGRTVYSTSFDATTDVPMDGYSIGAEGALAALPGSPYPTLIFGSEFQSVAVTPNQGPTALFSATPGGTRGGGTATQFNASGSSDSDGGSVVRYDWDFGDGTTLPDGGPNPSHVYAQAGDYTVTLTVTDDEGCSTQLLFTGQTADCNGTGAARSQQAIQVAGGPPVLKLSGKRKQKLARRVKVKARTSEDTAAVAGGRLVIAPPKKGKAALRSFRLKKHRANLVANRRKTLKPKLSKKAYRSALRALDNGRKVKAKVKVRVTDAEVNSVTKKRTVKLRKP